METEILRVDSKKPDQEAMKLIASMRQALDNSSHK